MPELFAAVEKIKPDILQRIHVRSGFDDKSLLPILTLIATKHSNEIPATPKLIATILDIDEKNVLTYMWKCYMSEYMTFQSEDCEPMVDTPFSLTAKAWRYLAASYVPPDDIE